MTTRKDDELNADLVQLIQCIGHLAEAIEILNGPQRTMATERKAQDRINACRLGLTQVYRALKGLPPLDQR